VMIRRAFDTSQSVAEGFLCLETSVSYVLKLDTTGTALVLSQDIGNPRTYWFGGFLLFWGPFGRPVGW
jgi:hypothetical protein